MNTPDASIEAIIDEGPSGTPFTPTIARRELSTTLTIPNAATVVISGLIREDRVKVVRKIPLLGDIPLLGVLFRRTVDTKRKTNLLVFVTPHVVTDMAEAAVQMDALRRRSGLHNEPVTGPAASEPVPLSDPGRE